MASDDATSFSVEVHKTLALEAYKASTYLAKERGAFAIYDAEREKTNPFIVRMKEADPVMYNNMAKYGRQKYSSAYHCTDRNNESDDPDYFRY